jgi:phytoene synthase
MIEFLRDSALVSVEQFRAGVLADGLRGGAARWRRCTGFARAVDDAVDEVGLDGRDPARARSLLNEWRKALERHVPPSGPEGWPLLKQAMLDFSIDKRFLLDLVDGVERDLTQTRYADWDDLKRYCYGVAGTVGLACLPIFGLDPVRHRNFAETLGQAVQLVNVIRDVKSDALRDRIYLPQEDLARFGLNDGDILALVYNGTFQKLMKFESDRARGLFEAALAALPDPDRRAARPALAMGRLYRKLLEKIESRRFDVYTTRPRLTPLEKIAAFFNVH